MTANASIRPIEPADDAAMAAIIRAVMPEFGASGDGFAINDPEVDWMSRAYSEPRHAYFVLERDGRVLGGAGIAPLAGGDASTCELRKMYFLPEARGQLRPLLPRNPARHGRGDAPVPAQRLRPH